ETITSIVANANGTFTYNDENGNPHVINIADLETLTVLDYDDAGHVLNYRDEDNTLHSFDLNVGKLDYDATTNTLTYTDEDGTPTTIAPNNTELEYDPATGILTYTNTLGQTQTVDLRAVNIAYNNTTSLLAATDVQAAIDELAANINSSEASNGLHIETIDPATEGHIKLGGALTKPTEIETDATNTLAITGLQPGDVDQDNLLVTDANGVLKTISPNKFVRFFYMPSIVFDTSSPNPTGPLRTRNLYQEYVNQFTGAGSPGLVGSTGAPETIPYLPQAEDLYYYITYYDDDVFADLSINQNGELSYRVIGPGTPTSFMNIVFVIKD
ncbi:hypothetical protein ACFOET_20180, partial [Parapedobacter deserti]